MKTMTKVVAVALVAVIMCMMLASCGNTISGTYSGKGSGLLSGVSYSYEFKGKNVTVTTKTEIPILGTIVNTQTGTYEIKDEKITFTWSEDDETNDKGTVVETGPYDFEKGSDYIKIGGLTLTKDK